MTEAEIRKAIREAVIAWATNTLEAPLTLEDALVKALLIKEAK